MRDLQTRYTAGQTIDWFGVTAPRQGDGFWLANNTGTILKMNTPTASGPGELTGSFGSGRKIASRLGDTLLRSGASQSISWSRTDAAGPQTYRYELDTTVEPTTWAWSTRTASAWTFVTDRAVGTLPLLGIGYDVATGLDGTVRAGGRTTVGLEVAHPVGAVGAGTVTDVALEVSYDEGATWSPVTVERSGDDWTAQLSTPKGGGSVSLRHDGTTTRATRSRRRWCGRSA
ncbi:hypothetical protein [Isoptericola jiangsuensis]|uniref:hypothetical protein n=1 Tax=Isoptericola jiangsuensis TaxID=548579 RepID=UPI000BF6D6C8|nr:hypothetical protein [Isoptericola jiangsuensis]